MAPSNSPKSDPDRTVEKGRDPVTGEERVRVSYSREGGAVVEAITTMSERRVRSEVAVTETDGSRERWVFEDDFKDDPKDAAFYVRERDGKIVEQTAISPSDYLARRAQLFRDRREGVVWGALGATYEASYTSAIVLSMGEDPSGKPIYALASLGVHAAFPFPGEHWDEGQLAILDKDMRPALTLKMPKESEQTHLDIAFEEIEGGAKERITYQGYMEDETGKLRFVQAEYVLEKKAVERENPSLYERITTAVNNAVGFRQNEKLLRDAGLKQSRLLIDGEPVMTVKTTLSALDDGARFKALPRSKLLSVNYAPSDAPLLSLIDPEEQQARYRFDATLLADEEGLFHKLVPSFLRHGVSKSHYVVDTEGRRREVDEALTIEEPPISSKSYTWELDGEPVALLQRDLVIVRDAKGNRELGFREVITKYS
jgi:hypothetical protein